MGFFKDILSSIGTEMLESVEKMQKTAKSAQSLSDDRLITKFMRCSDRAEKAGYASELSKRGLIEKDSEGNYHWK